MRPVTKVTPKDGLFCAINIDTEVTGLSTKNLQIYIISLYYRSQILPDYIHTKYIHVL